MARSQPKTDSALEPLMIRGDRLLLALRVMRLCQHEGEAGLSIDRMRSTFRARFGENSDVEAMECDLGNWYAHADHGPTVHQLLIDNPKLADVEINIASLVRISSYAGRDAGIRPVLELIASEELTEEDFMEETR